MNALRTALLGFFMFSPSAGSVAVEVELREGAPDKRTWDFPPPPVSERFSARAFGFVAIPKKYNERGVLIDRALPVLLSAKAELTLPAGEHRFLLRSLNGARLLLDGRPIASTAFIDTRGDGHEPVPERTAAVAEGIRPPAVGHREKLIAVTLDGGKHLFELQAFIGGSKLRPEIGELQVAYAAKGERFRLLSASCNVPLSDDAWTAYAAEQLAERSASDEATRKAASAGEIAYWRQRHDLARREWMKLPAPKLPNLPVPLEAINDVDRYLSKELLDRAIPIPAMVDDWKFLRRVFLDTVGTIPNEAETAKFFSDPEKERRRLAIDRLLADPRWADHWTSYWQDVLAENPGILKPNLNNTGPFRWWLHQSLSDNYGMDRFVTELIRMEGSKMYGGPGGFGMATENDSPLASKAHILAKAFLGIEMQCARCHDAPFHQFKQRDLFEAAAMLARGAQLLPITSTVRIPEGARKPRLQITLKPGDSIPPRWPFVDIATAELPAEMRVDRNDPREVFAATLTSPRNSRFAEVLVNRLWKRYFGWGLVEPVDDWPDSEPELKALLQHLARELATHDYDLKHVARRVLNSRAYQSVVQPGRADVSSERIHAGPLRRRLTAEQLVDGLFAAAGKVLDCEELCMDPEGRRPATEMQNLGVPKRAWQLTSLSNERDRPALALPRAQGIVDLLTAYGWRDSRQNPITVRDDAPTMLQPLVLANGAAANRIVRLSDDSLFTEMCVDNQPLETLIGRLFTVVLTRPPTSDEMKLFVQLLETGYADRKLPNGKREVRRSSGHSSTVSWANHLSPEATKIKLELERASRVGDQPTQRLKKEWRERFEDALWSLINSTEFAFLP